LLGHEIRYHPHALERMKERGAAEDEVETTAKQGEQFPTNYCIELLNANEGLKREDMGKLLVVNEATGEQKELSLEISQEIFRARGDAGSGATFT
jgi:hypothetical protein